MGVGRWLYNNLITAANMLTPSSTAAGIMGGVVPEAEGTATLYTLGGYAGNDDELYTVEVHDVSAGQEIGQALFRWKKAGSTGWEVTDLNTSDGTIPLDNGVHIKWVAGAGNDFELGDRWTFLARRPFGRSYMLDGDPNTEHRTTGVIDESYVIDLGRPQAITAFALCHHNISSGATITLQANPADSWGSPAYGQAITWTEKHLCFFLHQTYRYWRLRIQDSGNSRGYLRIPDIFLGTYFQPARSHHYTSTRSLDYVTQERQAASNLTGLMVMGQAEAMTVSYQAATAADITSFKAMRAEAFNTNSKEALPVRFIPDYDDPGDLIFGAINPKFSWVRREPLGNVNKCQLTIDELARLAA